MSPSLPPGFGIMLCYWGMPCKPILSCLHWTVFTSHTHWRLTGMGTAVTHCSMWWCPRPTVHTLGPASVTSDIRERERNENAGDVGEDDPSQSQPSTWSLVRAWSEIGQLSRLQYANIPQSIALLARLTANISIWVTYICLCMFSLKWFNRTQSIQWWFGIQIHIWFMWCPMTMCLVYVLWFSFNRTEWMTWIWINYTEWKHFKHASDTFGPSHLHLFFLATKSSQMLRITSWCHCQHLVPSTFNTMPSTIEDKR